MKSTASCCTGGRGDTRSERKRKAGEQSGLFHEMPFHEQK
jgi:hypothetical protein